MDTFFIRRLLFPPGVIVLLVALFQAFGVFDTLIIANEEQVSISVAVLTAAAPAYSEPATTSQHAAESSTTRSSSLSSTVWTNSKSTSREAVVTEVSSAMQTAPLSAANNLAISENAAHASHLSAFPPIAPLASNAQYVQERPQPEVIDEPFSQNLEVAATEMAQLAEIATIEEPILEQLATESPEQPQTN